MGLNLLHINGPFIHLTLRIIESTDCEATTRHRMTLDKYRNVSTGDVCSLSRTFRSSLLREMTVKVGRVRSLRVKGSCQPRHEGVPSPAYFDWRASSELAFPFSEGT
ncbi:hypothetical protein J6590_041542 [Homalodisca vitripennis]|nr:hypothetical protein J6590_041542 [Homalodisca vitripennis]